MFIVCLLYNYAFYRAKTVEINCDREVPINIDGEVELVRNAEFKIIPGGINIISPAQNLNYSEHH